MADADPAALARYETDVKPFLEPFDALFASSSVDGDLTRFERHHHRQVAGRPSVPPPQEDHQHPWQSASG